jgi:hypothetical protein
MPPLKTSLLGGAEIEFLQENVLRVLEDVGVDFGTRGSADASLS